MPADSIQDGILGSSSASYPSNSTFQLFIMLSPTFVITIAFPILFTINTYINYKSHAFIPKHGPFEPYLSLLLHLIVQIFTLQAAWGWSSPVLVKRFSSLARAGLQDQGMDEERRKAVNKVLVSYQTSCVLLLGTVLIPFIWISRAYSTQQLGIASTSGEYLKIGLWASAALTCGVCFRRESTLHLFFADV